MSLKKLSLYVRESVKGKYRINDTVNQFLIV